MPGPYFCPSPAPTLSLSLQIPQPTLPTLPQLHPHPRPVDAAGIGAARTLPTDTNASRRARRADPLPIPTSPDHRSLSQHRWPPLGTSLCPACQPPSAKPSRKAGRGNKKNAEMVVSRRARDKEGGAGKEREAPEDKSLPNPLARATGNTHTHTHRPPSSAWEASQPSQPLAVGQQHT